MHSDQRCVCRWEEDTEGVHVDLRQKSLDWLSECFEAAHQSARQAIDYMCNFIGMKVCTHLLWCMYTAQQQSVLQCGLCGMRGCHSGLCCFIESPREAYLGSGFSIPFSSDLLFFLLS